MTAEIHRLTTDGPVLEPDQNVIAFLRKRLAEAERGEYKAVIFAAVCANDGTASGWSRGCASDVAIAAAVNRLQYRFMKDDDESKELMRI